MVSLPCVLQKTVKIIAVIGVLGMAGAAHAQFLQAPNAATAQPQQQAEQAALQAVQQPVATVVVPAPARTVPATRAQVQLSFAPVVKQAAPAVVNIFTSRTVKPRGRSPLFDDPLFRQFFGNRFGVPAERTERSLGSGVIISGDGLIVTSNHVIKDSEEVTVVLADQREFKGEIILNDDQSDLALLRITAGKEILPYLPLRDSDTLEVGDMVLAIGNPFGVGQTVTSGIISALARTTQGISDYQFFIQTDAAINPGNSGGALVDMQGHLIGVNTAIYSTSGASNGVGFAIPANMVHSVMTSAKSGAKHVVRPWLGISVQAVNSEVAESLGMQRPRGVLIQGVTKTSPAEQAGLTAGDVILAVNGYDINDIAGLHFRSAISTIGEPAAFKILRGGKEETLSVKMVAPPENPARDVRKLAGAHPLNDISVANLSPAVAVEIGLDANENGAVVVDPGTNRLMEKGDIILQVNGKAIPNTKSLEALMNGELTAFQMAFKRKGQIMQVAMR